MESAGPYASLHITLDRWPHQHPTTQFFTGRMPFLPPNQQHQSTERSYRRISPLGIDLYSLHVNVLIFSNNGLWLYCHNVVPQYVLTFICFRPALCFILVYDCGLTVHNKRICYVVLCYVMFVSTLFLMQFRISELTNNRHPVNSFVSGITMVSWY